MGILRGRLPRLLESALPNCGVEKLALGLRRMFDHNGCMKIIVILCTLMLAEIVFAQNKSPLYEIPLKDINDRDASLKEYQGKVLLVVNVASQCGLTPQYQALEAAHRKYKNKGFAVLG